MKKFAPPIMTVLACLFACYGGAAAQSAELKDDLAAAQDDLAAALARLEPLTAEAAAQVESDWLVVPAGRKTGVYSEGESIVLTNGLIRRDWRVQPDCGCGCVAFDNLMTGAALLRGVKPEARVILDGTTYDVGGLLGQGEYAYLRPEWVEDLTADPAAFHLAAIETGPARERFAWNRKRYSADLPWPPPGRAVTFTFAPPAGAADAGGAYDAADADAASAAGAADAHAAGLDGLTVAVHYEMYDGIPLICKWLTIRNGTGRAVTLDTFTSEILAAVEYDSHVEAPGLWEFPNIHVESDCAFLGTCRTTHWVPDPQYRSQVSYHRMTPNLLESRPLIGPAAVIAAGGELETFCTFELVHDSTERERQGLAVRRMYRIIAPWVTENPILMHVRGADDAAVRLAVDQCAEVGFEMVIMTFGSGFDAETGDPAEIARLKALADYAHAKGVELGGYSLLASRRISDEHDVINPETGKPGGAAFGNSPCLGSVWGREYFEKVKDLFAQTGLDVLEHDGSYPGDVCASTAHPGHRGLADSQWTQWKTITDFYKWCRGRGIYLNVPDWYFLTGSNKTGMGYRETNWSLPRARQIILGRQNIFDGTWRKTPSMGWMFVPLVEYHGGGAAATLEPLSDHLDAYGAHLAQNFGSGVQACYRGPRLFDTEATRALVKHWVDFYKRYRPILDADIIHLRRADARDLDCLLHVDPRGLVRALAMVFNPLDTPVKKELRLPLYYAGVTDTARVRQEEGEVKEYGVGREYEVSVPVEVEARGVTWLVVE